MMKTILLLSLVAFSAEAFAGAPPAGLEKILGNFTLDMSRSSESCLSALKDERDFGADLTLEWNSAQSDVTGSFRIGKNRNLGFGQYFGNINEGATTDSHGADQYGESKNMSSIATWDGTTLSSTVTDHGCWLIFCSTNKYVSEFKVQPDGTLEYSGNGIEDTEATGCIFTRK